MTGTQRPHLITPQLRQITAQAKANPDRVFTSLVHHMDFDLLREAYYRLRREGAPGLSGIDARDYAQDLEANLNGLHERLRTRTYQAAAVKRVWIDKDDGKKRPIGITEIEDKIVQKAVSMLMGAVYEQDDGGIMRLIGKWLHAGVMDGAALSYTDKGTPQGGVISPLLANIYLHHVLDTWFETEVKPRMRGHCFLVRFADDFVIGFQREDDARRVLQVLAKRFARFGLELHPEKSRLIEFGRPARAQRSGQGANTFDFVGFTHYWARSRRGYWVIKRKTKRKTVTKHIQGIRAWCRRNRHRPLEEQHRIVSAKLRSHYQYFGVRGNLQALVAVREQALRA